MEQLWAFTLVLVLNGGQYTHAVPVPATYPDVELCMAAGVDATKNYADVSDVFGSGIIGFTCVPVPPEEN